MTDAVRKALALELDAIVRQIAVTKHYDDMENNRVGEIIPSAVKLSLSHITDSVARMRAALASLDAGAGVAAGWKMVPKEMTKEMVQACKWALDRWREQNGDVQGYVPPDQKYQIRWRAMLSAAPEPQQEFSLAVTVAIGYLDGVMKLEIPEIRKQWQTVRAQAQQQQTGIDQMATLVKTGAEASHAEQAASLAKQRASA